MDLFDSVTSSSLSTPLAERLRPQVVDDFLFPESSKIQIRHILRVANELKTLPNLIFWGPPGTGKTSLARLLIKQADCYSENVNAISIGAKGLRDIGESAKARKKQFGRASVLFIDEIHRLNKAQQDVLLPYSEAGDFSFIGATTENPGYEINNAILSRSTLVRFEGLSNEALSKLIERAEVASQSPLGSWIGEESISRLFAMANGDVRQFLNFLEILSNSYQLQKSASQIEKITWDEILALIGSVTLRFDRNGDQHYTLASALIKSIRGSDPDAAVYYLARLLEAGEDPKFIARRLIISASEDIGNADPRALQMAVAGQQAVLVIGMPEARITLSQVVCYLASAPKSNATYNAINSAIAEVKSSGALDVPNILVPAQTSFAKKMNFGQDYKYAHDFPKGFVHQQYLPTKILGKKFYLPKDIGFEKRIHEFLSWLKSK